MMLGRRELLEVERTEIRQEEMVGPSLMEQREIRLAIRERKEGRR